MSVERAVQERWQTDATLCTLLPAARLFTGTVPSDASGVAGTGAEPTARRSPGPYATLTRLDTKPVLRTSSGTALDEVRLELSLWAESLETAQRIVAAVERRFERSNFHTS